MSVVGAPPPQNGGNTIPATQKGNDASRGPTNNFPSPKLKIIVRRLAPGLTEAEFNKCIGDEWRIGKGKVDWFLYKAGKVSRESVLLILPLDIVMLIFHSQFKPSRPSRAYLHLTNADHVLAFADLIRRTPFEDALHTHTSSVLVGPPVVEFAPYSRHPGGKRRVDARAGTIDQDLEFMAFLEGLANPEMVKEPLPESNDSSTKLEKITVTPLVQYLKDKKALKLREAAAKAAKKMEVKGKTKDASQTLEDSRKQSKDHKSERSLNKTAKETVKILNRVAASKGPATTNVAAESSKSHVADRAGRHEISKTHATQRSAAIAAHARTLRRDLGLGPAQAQRQAKKDAAGQQKPESSKESLQEVSGDVPDLSTTKSVPTAPRAAVASRSARARGKASESLSNATNSIPSKTAKPSSSTQPDPAKPVVLLRKADHIAPTGAASQASKHETPQPMQASAPNGPSASRPSFPANRNAPNGARGTPVISAFSTRQAFIKHANASQGVTEPLLKATLEKFGPITFIEIDKRKGFAYVDFKEDDGLRAAIAGSPVSVAQGTVVVMPRKTTAPSPGSAGVSSSANTAKHTAGRAPSQGSVPRGGRGGSMRRGGRGGHASRGSPSGTGPGISAANKRAENIQGGSAT